MRRVPGTQVTAYHGRIQDKDEAYYMQFDMVICGLDSVSEAGGAVRCSEVCCREHALEVWCRKVLRRSAETLGRYAGPLRCRAD